MSAAEHIPEEQALFLVALEDSDPEKQAALSHAASCELCTRLLNESQAMLRVLDDEAMFEPIAPALEARIHAAVFAKQPQAARGFARFEPFAWLLGAAVSGLMIWLDGKPNLPLEPMVGMRCMRFELGFAAAALSAGVLVTRLGSLQRLGPLRSSVLAMTGALVGQALLRTRCEAADAALHLIAFHATGVVLATVLGAVAGRALQGPVTDRG